MKRLLPFLCMMVFIACSPEEINVKNPDVSEEQKTASVIINNIPEGYEGDSVYVFTLDNDGEFYSATTASGTEDAIVKTSVPEGNASFTIIAYFPSVSDWSSEDAFDRGYYSTLRGATNRTGRYITQTWSFASSYFNSSRSGMNNTLEVDLRVEGTLNIEGLGDFEKGDIIYLEAEVDNNTLSSIASVDFSIDGTLIESIDEEPYEINFNTIDLGAGEHELSVTVTNADGDVAMDGGNIVVVIAQNEAPYVNISGISNGATYTRQSVRTIRSNASDPEGDLDRVEFIINGTTVATVTEFPYEYVWDTYDNQVGLVTVEVAAYDVEGAKRSDFANVTLEAPENYAPRVTITSPSNGSTFTIGSTININASTSDDEGDAIGAVYFYFDGGFIGSDNTAPYAIENFDTSGYTAGEYEVFVRVYNETFSQSSYETITITLVN